VNPWEGPKEIPLLINCRRPSGRWAARSVAFRHVHTHDAFNLFLASVRAWLVLLIPYVDLETRPEFAQCLHLHRPDVLDRLHFNCDCVLWYHKLARPRESCMPVPPFVRVAFFDPCPLRECTRRFPLLHIPGRDKISRTLMILPCWISSSVPPVCIDNITIPTRSSSVL
jgi:hypothetical protein